MNSFNDLLTRQDCEHLLEQKLRTNQFKLVQYSIAPMSDKMDGFMGYHLRLKCLILLHKTKETKLVTFFVKKQLINAIDNEFITECLQTWPGERKEALFYNIMADVWTEQIKWIPRYYSFNKDPTLLVLDDLSEYGFTVLRNTLCDLAECKATLKALAQMHAFSIKYEADKTKQFNKAWTFLDAYGDALFEENLFTWNNKYAAAWFRQSIEAIKGAIEFFEKSKTRADILKNRLENIVDHLMALFKPSTHFRNVICHGDLWSKNLMYKYDRNQVAQQAQIIDFQIVRYLPPMHDIIMLLYVNTTSAFRKEYLNELLNFYYDEFADELQFGGIQINDVLTKLDFEQSFYENLTFGKVCQAIYRQTVEAGEDNLTKMLDTKHKGFEFLLIDRKTYLLPLLKQNGDYMNNVGSVIYELCEYLIESEITREDCYKIIDRQLHTSNYELVKFNLTSIVQKNFVIDQKILHIFIKYQNHIVEFNYLVKLPSNNKYLINHEINAYRNIFEQMTNENILQIPKIYEIIPKYYHAIQNHFIILENLSTNGFKTLNTYDKLNYEHVKLVIQTLAKFHATSFIYESQNPLNNNNKLERNSFYEKEFIESIFNAIIMTLNELFPDEKELNNITNVIKSFEKSYENYLKPSTIYKNVLCHNNLQQNNLMFKLDSKNEYPIESRLINLNKCRYLPPAVDIAIFLHLTTDVTLRNNHYDDILNLYYTSLKTEIERSTVIENMDDILTYYELLESTKEMETFVIFQTAIYSHFNLINEKFINNNNNNKDIINLKAELQDDLLKENLKLHLNCNKLVKETHLALIKHCINNIVS